MTWVKMQLSLTNLYLFMNKTKQVEEKKLEGKSPEVPLTTVSIRKVQEFMI